ncbi:hypothetical protein B7463_g2206, partial [Scytalidium lignicola]
MSASLTDPWVIARDQYISDLTVEERKLFEHATLENILLTSTEDQIQHEQQSQSRAVMRRLKPFLSVIEEFGAAFDVFLNTYSLVLAPLWGSLRVIFLLASKYNEIFDRIVEVLERIGYVVPRFRDYERIFGTHLRIISALSTVYLDIITLCTEIKGFIRSIAKSRIKSFAKLFAPLDHHLGEVISRFRLHREDVELEVEACHMIEAAKDHDLAMHDREVAILERKKDFLKHIRSLLSPIDYVDRQRKALRSCQPGTGQWIFDETQYKEWKSSTESSLLNIFGIPGCGKTILLSCIIDDLGKEIAERELLVHHYCDYKDPRSLDPMTVIGTLINGLLEGLDISEELSCLICNVFRDGQRSLEESDMLQILDHVLDCRLDYSIYVVVDGVDEVEERERKALFKLLKHFAECPHSSIKLIVSSRASVSEMICLPCRLHVTQANISNDIDKFVRQATEKLILSDELMIRDASLKDEIVQRLAHGARGMFLWVKFQLDSLCDCDSDASIQEALENLPQSLTETYERLLGKIQNFQRRILVRHMMQWITCARRNLSIDELLEGVAFTIDDDHWDSAKIPIDPGRLIRASGNLLVIDDEDRSVQLAHYTVQQFLLVDALNQISLSSFTYHFTREEAERYVGEICVIYLCFSDFETQITRYINRTTTHMEVIEKALLNSDSIVQGGFIVSAVSALSNFLRSRDKYQPSNIDYARHLPYAPRGLRPKYELLGYVVNEWLHHTTNFMPEEQCGAGIDAHIAKIWNHFKTLVYRKQLLFKLRPWDGAMNNNQELPHMPLICWAMRYRHEALLRSVNDENIAPLGKYFEAAAKWFGSKNIKYLF